MMCKISGLKFSQSLIVTMGLLLSLYAYPETPVPTSSPVINSLTPVMGTVGTTIQIKGSALSTSNLNYIRFGKGLLGPFSSPDGTTLSFVIPAKSIGGCNAPSFQPLHCLALLNQETVPGNYQVSIITPNGQSNSINFTVK